MAFFRIEFGLAITAQVAGALVLEQVKLCDKCESVGYCSYECQKNDWKAHKLDCQANHHTFCPFRKASQGSIMTPRFAVGTEVECYLDDIIGWWPGRVIRHHYHQSGWKRGYYHPYGVQLKNGDLNGVLVHTEHDFDLVIRLNIAVEQPCPVCQRLCILRRCRQCQAVAYCSVECQKQNWQAHRDLCKETASLNAKHPMASRIPFDMCKLRFNVGAEVDCNLEDDWVAGTVVKHYHVETMWSEDPCKMRVGCSHRTQHTRERTGHVTFGVYQIKLNSDGSLICAPRDDASCISQRGAGGLRYCCKDPFCDH